ncbi:hypothetical protein RCL_jg21359.t1 [Rhizophagus clarus]|uniref:Uncharacterized protein n=1 Tax=Rhizophagus clarus TaxID=94130 RepID=A0A8H3QVC8_9GLOM|nr:hypothetical protein RCL_jg21359.t1 [Rhizophagus clarus]
MNIIWNGISHIDKNIRKWYSIPISAKNFNRLIGSSTYKAVPELISAKIIDWEATTFWLNHNPHSSPTSLKLLKILSHCIKAIIFMLPTGLCASHQSSCISIMESHRLFLINILTQNSTTSSPADISHSVNSYFKRQIWNIHASSLKAWESTQLNITSKSKRSYKSKFSHHSKRTPRQHVHITDVIRPNRTRQPSDFGPSMTSRIYRHPNVNYAQHLIWASIATVKNYDLIKKIAIMRQYKYYKTIKVSSYFKRRMMSFSMGQVRLRISKEECTSRWYPGEMNTKDMRRHYKF